MDLCGTNERFARVGWSPVDIFDLRPDWTYEQAEEFLQKHGKYIQEAMVRAGWDAIETLLPPESKKEDL